MRVHKIHKNYEYRIVYNKGKSFSNNLFVMYIYKNKKNNLVNRLGISVSKKVGKSVTRNRVRRLVYEVYRLNLSKLKTGYDIVFIARSRSNDKSYVEIEKNIVNLLNKGMLINE